MVLLEKLGRFKQQQEKCQSMLSNIAAKLASSSSTPKPAPAATSPFSLLSACKIMCLKFKTDQAQEAKKMEKLNNIFFTLMARGPDERKTFKNLIGKDSKTCPWSNGWKCQKLQGKNRSKPNQQRREEEENSSWIFCLTHWDCSPESFDIMQCYKVQPSSPNKPAKELIMFEQHCNIENLGRVNKVKVKRQITVKSLQLEPLCNQNTLIQDGKEMASVLYTYRSCVKALPPGVCWNSQFGIQKFSAEIGAASIYCGFWF
ncbi:hypothetical protein PVK06_044657 [Gossypium arboreum]|uniref:Uncharacterized protein n=1 Tax=Gossypium arboreum TaxID=29729 RepID=A0ABR0MS21_GOSAR|nr:hypothetical protein PVK06_044657 [Gossypium arboreum]